MPSNNNNMLTSAAYRLQPRRVEVKQVITDQWEQSMDTIVNHPSELGKSAPFSAPPLFLWAEL